MLTKIATITILVIAVAWSILTGGGSTVVEIITLLLLAQIVLMLAGKGKE